jgi:hypothetical protein
MCSPSPPPPPDFAAAAAAQGVANVDAARATAKLNNPNIVAPGGTTSVQYGSGFDQTGYDAALAKYNADLTAFNSGQGDSNGVIRTSSAAPTAPDRNKFVLGDPDVPTVTQSLSPANQNIYDTSLRIKQALGGLGEQGTAGLKDVIGKNLDLSGVPQTGDYNSTRSKVIDAMLSRVNEDTARNKDQANSDLIARGIRPGTKAYDDEMFRIDRGYNDARQQAEIAGGNAAQQAYGIDSDKRRQAIAEILSQRQTPLNEISALMSGSQVANPFTQAYQGGATVQPAPVANAASQLNAYNTDIYNQSVGSKNALLGTAGMLGSAYMMAPVASDVRLKTDIERIGTHKLGFGIYSFRYLWDRVKRIGVMAQEVLPILPQAVVKGGRYLMVDYSLIGDLHG